MLPEFLDRAVDDLLIKRYDQPADDSGPIHTSNRTNVAREPSYNAGKLPVRPFMSGTVTGVFTSLGKPRSPYRSCPNRMGG